MIFTPDKTIWFDIAHRTGLNEEESEKSWNHFGANGWKRGNQIKIDNWDQVPFLLNTWKWNQPQFATKEKSKTQRHIPFELQSRSCSATKNKIKCGKQAVCQGCNDMGYDYYRCEEHKPKGA